MFALVARAQRRKRTFHRNSKSSGPIQDRNQTRGDKGETEVHCPTHNRHKIHKQNDKIHLGLEAVSGGRLDVRKSVRNELDFGESEVLAVGLEPTLHLCFRRAG